MRRTIRSILCSISLLAFVPHVTHAQVTTGAPPFSSFGGGPDTINLANLNSHIVVPVIHKAGRGGFNFTYDLSYDTSIWYPVGSSGNQNWQPVNNWGWRGITEVVTGYLSETVTSTVCSYTNLNGDLYPNGWYTTISNEVYHDYLGVPHAFAGSTWTRYSTCPGGYGSGGQIGPTSIDGFYTLVSNNSGVVDRYGKFIAAPMNTTSGSANATDRNGNQISIDNNGNFTDTLGSTALTVAGSAPVTFTYTPPSGASAAYTMSYITRTVKTNFGCGIAEYGPISNSLVDRITLPDGSFYQFNYEPTPGFSGDYTGRLASVILPTGGTITYTYTGGSSGHITCSDGSASGYTRQTPDGTWTYARTMGSGAASTTTITDPQGNVTQIQFQGIYETQRSVYVGAIAQIDLLHTWNTCYNGAVSPCNGTAVTLPITLRTVTDQDGPSGIQCKHVYDYNAFGLLTEQDDYDYASGTPTTILRKEIIAYASLGNNIVNQPSSISIQNGSGTPVAQTTFCYDEGTPSGGTTCAAAGSPTATSGTPQHVAVSGSRGNVTTIAQLVQGSSVLGQKTTYYDTGTVNTSIDVNSAVTTFNYAAGAADNGDVASTIATGTQNFNRSYAYDALNRVQSTSDTNTSQTCRGLSWNYDVWGNRTAQNVTAGTCWTSAVTVNNKNQLVGPPYQYDAAGNMTADGSHTYTYDAENHLTAVDSGNTASYVYDALGRRVHRAGAGVPVATDYVYDLSGNVVAEFAPSCSGAECFTVGYVYLAGQIAAEYRNATTYFVHGDHLGSARLVTGVNQAVVQNLDYLPFGEINSTDSGISTHKFTGDERDAETSLDHTQYRQYTSSLARWITPDPAGLAAVDPTNPQSWNRYAYVLNNPLNFIDPSGMGPGLCDVHVWDYPGCVGGPGGNGGLTCIMDGVDVGCAQVFHQLFHDDKFAALKAAYTPTSFVPNPKCPNGDCANPTANSTLPVYGNIGLLAFLGAVPGSGNSSWWGTFGKTFVNGVLHGDRQPGQSFGACVLQNADQTTFGAHKAIIGTMLAGAASFFSLNSGLTTKMAVWTSISVRNAQSGFINLATVTAIAQGFSTASSALIRAGEVAAAAETGLLIGSAINCR